MQEVGISKKCNGPLHKGAFVDLTNFTLNARECRDCKRHYYRNRTPEAVQAYKERNNKWMKGYRRNLPVEELRAYNRAAQAKFMDTLENRIWKRLCYRSNKSLKGYPRLADSYEALIGCNKTQFAEYLKPLMSRGMHKGNYGKHRLCWQIDHIIPLCKFDLTTLEGQRAAFHYTNVQPLWATENWAKGRKPLGVLGSARAVEVPFLEDSASGGMSKPLLDDINRDLEFDYAPSSKGVA